MRFDLRLISQDCVDAFDLRCVLIEVDLHWLPNRCRHWLRGWHTSYHLHLLRGNHRRSSHLVHSHGLLLHHHHLLLLLTHRCLLHWVDGCSWMDHMLRRRTALSHHHLSTRGEARVTDLRRWAHLVGHSSAHVVWLWGGLHRASSCEAVAPASSSWVVAAVPSSLHRSSLSASHHMLHHASHAW